MSYTFDPTRGYVKKPRKLNCATYREHFKRYGAPALRLKNLPVERINSREGLR